MLLLYHKAAALLKSNNKCHIVVGDLHLGLERKLYEKGIKMHTASEVMANTLMKIADDYKTKSIILLGDVKESILNPDVGERRSINQFFDALNGFDIKIASGNHDSRLGDLVKAPIEDEIIMGNVALLHGNAWPSEAAMQKDYLIVAHNHVAVAFKDKNGRAYAQKAWLVSGLDSAGAKKRYKKFNAEIKLVVMPAFNDLIIGMPVNAVSDSHINPLFRNRVFNYEESEVYSMDGILIGSPSSLKAAGSIPL